MNLNKTALAKGYFLFTICLIFYVKFLLIPFETADFIIYLDQWCSFIVQNEYMHAFKTKYSDYPPLYLYYLTAISKLLHANELLTGIKLLSILFDFLLALFSYKIIFHCTQNNKWSLLGGCVAFSLPTVIFNGSLWGQCDSIYGSLAVVTVYYFLVKRNILAFVFLGIAFSLKLQIVFIFPLLGILYFSERGIKLWYFLIIPAIYFISLIPAWIFGGNLLNLLSIYVDQSDEYRVLTMNAPSIYTVLPNFYFLLKTIAILIAALVVISIYYLYFSNPFLLTDKKVLAFCFLFSVIVPYFLPAMHERYFFLADIFSLIYCFCHKEKFHYAILLQVISIFSYWPYLFGYQAIEIKYLSIGFAVLIYFLLKDVLKPTLQAIKESNL